MLSTSATAKRLIADGKRPDVLGLVVVEVIDDVADALFAALAHVADGADGIDLALPASASPSDRLALADQFAEATAVSMVLRSDAPMAVGSHAIVIPDEGGRMRANVLHDMGVVPLDLGHDCADAEAFWSERDRSRRHLLDTTKVPDLSSSQLMGLVAMAFHAEVAAVSTDRVRIVRRVLDTLAPLSSRPSTGSVSRCP